RPPRPSPRRARGSGLRLLLDRLSHPFHQGAGGLPRGAGDSGDEPAVGILARLTRPPHGLEDPMHFEGSVEIAAPRDRVWAFVIDPNQVGQCGPGVESIEVIDDTHFKATAKVGIGFISARFVVNMEMAEQQPPDRAVIKAHGQAPGSAVDATAQMTLSDGDGAGTRMDWNADVLISGSLASLGARLIEGTANKMIGQTFDCMKARLEG